MAAGERPEPWVWPPGAAAGAAIGACRGAMCFYKFVKIVVRRVLGVRSSPLGRSSTAACHGSPGWDRDIARRRFPAGGRPRDSLWCFRGLLSRRFLWRTCRPVGATFGRAIERSSSAWCVVGGEPAAVGGRGGNSACFGPTPLLGSLLCYFAKVHRSPALPRVEPPGTALIWVAHCGQFRVSSAPAWWWAVAWVDFYLFFIFFIFLLFCPFRRNEKRSHRYLDSPSPPACVFTVQTKGTTSFGKRHNKSHTICRRCGKRSFHIQRKTIFYLACSRVVFGAL